MIKANVVHLSECVETTIRCDYCGDKTGGMFDVLECAEYADSEGWKVGSTSKVKCKKCAKKMKRK